jgi:hypothetical protein
VCVRSIADCSLNAAPCTGRRFIGINVARHGLGKQIQLHVQSRSNVTRLSIGDAHLQRIVATRRYGCYSGGVGGRSSVTLVEAGGRCKRERREHPHWKGLEAMTRGKWLWGGLCELGNVYQFFFQMWDGLWDPN